MEITDDYDALVCRCANCGKRPEQIEEYVTTAKAEPKYFKDAEDVVRKDEGTYDPSTKLFVCSDCYIKLGMPVNGKLFGIYERIRDHMRAWEEDPK